MEQQRGNEGNSLNKDSVLLREQCRFGLTLSGCSRRREGQDPSCLCPTSRALGTAPVARGAEPGCFCHLSQTVDALKKQESKTVKAGECIKCQNCWHQCKDMDLGVFNSETVLSSHTKGRRAQQEQGTPHLGMRVTPI